MHLEIYTSFDEEGEEIYKVIHLVITIFGIFFSIKFGSDSYKFINKATSFRVERMDRAT